MSNSLLRNIVTIKTAQSVTIHRNVPHSEFSESSTNTGENIYNL